MNVKEIETKIEKKKAKIAELETQQIEIGNKIEKLQTEIDKLNNIIYQSRFDEITDVVSAKGLSIDDVLKAIKDGDLIALQKQMEDYKRDENIQSITNN